ncbi:DUF898 family protein [Escherichia albertii]|uniref:DUF898 domain-containing protein n=2 Tax=Escherichia albertii TaxID=208962 RepID=A0ABX5HH17_ESCAL|nr:DUF898 family protein [Escherichia albertii]EFB1502454.1 DUF898 family protein [Escherichia albertii]EJS1735008.1 DUF898 family protein [Escherichia albertii]MCU7271267.1 DUF898 family protein [Escherichia albertii]MCZ8594536.1 DUF898 family protein [Escherichia albertii]MCZ8664680.1 DUF898 family protein [Escherichia albertii]
MNDVTIGKDNSRHSFVFTGKGGEYFLICLVNFLLTIITLGIYGPWALVKCRRYIYQHVTLKGQSFSYKGTGGAIFISFLFLMVVYFLSVFCFSSQHFALGGLLFALLICGIPCMAVKSLQYQANMTSLNGIRFGFNCSMLRAWWVMLGLPVLLALAFWFILYLIAQVTTSIGGLFFNLVMLSLLSVVGLGVIHGVTYSKWMPLLGNNSKFGVHQFSIKVSVKDCVKGCMLAILTLVPFIVVIGIMIAPVFQQLMMMSMLGRTDAGGELIMQYYSQIMASYFLYFVAILVFASYLYATLRNLFLNNLALANGTIRFHSSITTFGILLRMFAVLIGSSVTCGLAYPWLKMWMVSWIANNTHVQGDLDSLELTNDDKPQDSGPLMWISRGIMPYVPFI